ncbi:MAG: hypothetical protein AABW47_01500 [Nanoarchaeota archaeon]
MVLDLLSNITAIVALIGILVGTLIGPRVTHQIGSEQSRKDFIFKKKVEYFEKNLVTIEKNIRLYKEVIGKAGPVKEEKELDKLTDALKHNRESFLIMSSPLYFDTRKISEKIIRFTRVEKEIFNRVSLLNKSKDKKTAVEELTNLLEILKKRGSDILFEMKRELAR